MLITIRRVLLLSVLLLVACNLESFRQDGGRPPGRALPTCLTGLIADRGQYQLIVELHPIAGRPHLVAELRLFAPVPLAAVEIAQLPLDVPAGPAPAQVREPDVQAQERALNDARHARRFALPDLRTVPTIAVPTPLTATPPCAVTPVDLPPQNRFRFPVPVIAVTPDQAVVYRVKVIELVGGEVSAGGAFRLVDGRVLP